MDAPGDRVDDLDQRAEPAALIPAQRDAFSAYAECYALRLETLGDPAA